MGGCSDAKVTTMILNVDLDCCPCYLKVKKLLCKFPQIRNQVFDEKQNTVTITVVCCSPEKIRDKLCEKGGKSIKGIAIKESKKADPEKSKPKSEEKSKGGDEQKENKEKEKGKSKGEDEKKEKKEKGKSKGDDENKEKKEKSKGEDEKPKSKSGDENKEMGKDKEKGSGEKSKEKKVSFDQSDAPKQKEAPPPAAQPVPAAAAAQAWMAKAEAQWMPSYPPGPPPQVYPVTVYYGGVPSHCYDGVPVAPPCYQNHQGYGYSYSHQPHYANRSDYFNDENPAACSIM